MASVIERGGTVALPVVVEKARPLIFRAYRPGDRLEKGVWNIPVPADGAAVTPDIVIAPLVGFDGGKFRLGYGGGFFDRTLAGSPQSRWSSASAIRRNASTRSTRSRTTSRWTGS